MPMQMPTKTQCSMLVSNSFPTPKGQGPLEPQPKNANIGRWVGKKIWGVFSDVFLLPLQRSIQKRKKTKTDLGGENDMGFFFRRRLFLTRWWWFSISF
jgi:hypothetical protein